MRVILGDDHAMLRQGLAALLREEPDIEVLGQAGHGVAVLELARTLLPDVVVVDMGMPVMSGLEVIRLIRAEMLPCKPLCLSVSGDPGQVLAALEAGACGYVLKANCYQELVRGIRQVVSNQVFLSAELVAPVIGISRSRSGGCEGSLPSRLTGRERQITQLLAEGRSTGQVARQLHISAKTVATHREHVFRKLKIRSVAELTRYALREGIISLG